MIGPYQYVKRSQKKIPPKIDKKMGDLGLTIAIEITELFSNDDRDLDRDHNFFKDQKSIV